MHWTHPSVTKIYEALGTVADGRLEMSGNTAKSWSSSGNKYYDISFDPDAWAIMSNDNAAYWKGSLGYPAIAFLLAKGVLPYDPTLASLLKGVKWKDVNTQFKNDFDAALEHILGGLPKSDRDALAAHVADIDAVLRARPLAYLGKKKAPPTGY